MEDPQKERMPAIEADIEARTIGGARLHGGPVILAEYDFAWPDMFAREAARVTQVLGDKAITIEHVGSTSVPGLAAKPIIDILMEVADSNDEPAYVTPLESNGYELRIREPDWWEHRMFKGPDTDVNLHVFTVGCPEVDRMLRFRNHLRSDAADRLLYESKKRELASQDWAYIQNYADAKTAVIDEIIARADPAVGRLPRTSL
ncbi:MAG TPA: GrpB family protein [Pirellulales bacterium]|jgi:GrpB-like predicted nucleotidyltransferase (UPF0157 family)